MDKLEKLRKEIERLGRKVMGVRTDFADGQKGVLTELLSFIDSMQKECKFKVGDRIRLQGTTAIGDVITNIYTAEDDKVYFEFENSDDALADLDWELVEWSKKCMYANDNYTYEDRKVLCEDCDHRCAYGVQNIGDYDHKAVIEDMMADVEEKSKAFTEAHKGESSDKILSEMIGEEPEEECKGCNNFDRCNYCMDGEEWAYKEEPGSEELENEIQDFFERWMEDQEYNQAVMPNFKCAGLEDCRNIARHFARWQKEQYINEGISPKDAYFGHLLEESWANGRLSGIHEYKQQMMKDATDVTVHIDAGNYPYIPQLELYDYDNDVALAKEGDKYKVVLIKE